MGQEPTQPKPEGNAGTGTSDHGVCTCTAISLGFALTCPSCQYRLYEQILEDVAEILEGGEIIHDLYSIPSAATTISIVSDTVNNALKGVKALGQARKALREIQ
tara:strand:+ start:1640 stop:1951 length:312 start_codon:yes stop_codon:yes gene_type:complete